MSDLNHSDPHISDLSISKELASRFKAPETENSYFISFEGIEGAGKTTQINHLKNLLEAKGYQVDMFREPGGTDFGEKLRAAILGSKERISPMAEACLFAASRAQLLESKILPILNQTKRVVIIDRFIDSSLAYQGIARDLGMESVLKLHQQYPLNTVPHLSFYLKIDVETSLKRQSARGHAKDYFEKENIAFYNNLIKGYDQAAAIFQKRFKVLDGAQSPEKLQEIISKEALELIKY